MIAPQHKRRMRMFQGKASQTRINTYYTAELLVMTLDCLVSLACCEPSKSPRNFTSCRVRGMLERFPRRQRIRTYNRIFLHRSSSRERLSGEQFAQPLLESSASVPGAIVAAGPIPPCTIAPGYRLKGAQPPIDPAFHRRGDGGRFAGTTYTGCHGFPAICRADPGAWPGGHVTW